jgi:hypothetical protein
MMLRGYRTRDAELLTGPWLPGELLGLPVAGRPPLAEPAVTPPPRDRTAELCVVPGLAFVRFSDIDWIKRRARLETGVRPEAADSVEQLLKSAVAHAFQVLNLHRVYGWVTPAAHEAAADPGGTATAAGGRAGAAGAAGSTAGGGLPEAPAGVLAGAGFQREATVPEGIWFDGRPVDRQIWGTVRGE